MAQITKAVIPVAGLGTRMLPATKAIPKEMLPVVDKPLIQYVVNECVAAGIKEIVLVTHASKNSIENHFDTSFELEATLEKRVKRQLLEEVQAIVPKDVTIMHIRQGVANGLGHAILCAKPVVGDAPFAIVLPDVILDDVACNLKKDNLADMVSKFNTSRVSQVLVEEVPHKDVNKELKTRKPVSALLRESSITSMPSESGSWLLSASNFLTIGKACPGSSVSSSFSI